MRESDPLHHSNGHLMRCYRIPRQKILNLYLEQEAHIARPTRRSHAIATHTQVLVSRDSVIFGKFDIPEC